MGFITEFRDCALGGEGILLKSGSDIFHIVVQFAELLCLFWVKAEPVTEHIS